MSGGDGRGERDRPDMNRIAVLEAVIDARGRVAEDADPQERPQLVMGIREREAKSIAERKNTLAVKLANVAEIGAERMEEMIGKAGLHDTTIATGVARDKVIALTSQTQ